MDLCPKESKGVKTGMKSSCENLPVHIVEQHNDVVPFIHRAIASKLLPFSGIPIIHLDSHPDLLIPIHLDADIVFKPRELCESLSIENWLLPLTYAKHIDHVIWVKPPWANQIKASKQTFSIGKCCATGKLRLYNKENYFLTDGLFSVPKKLTNCADCKLTVVELCPKNWKDLDIDIQEADTRKQRKDRVADSNPSKIADRESLSNQHQASSNTTDLSTPSKCAAGTLDTVSKSGDGVDNNVFLDYENWSKYLREVVTNKPYILDVDLDFFSTKNPFKEEFQMEKEIIQKVFKCPVLTGTSDEEVEAFTSSRQRQLDHLEVFFNALDDKWLVNDSIAMVEAEELKDLILEDLTDLDSEQLDCFAAEEKTDLLRLCKNMLPTMHEREITFNQIFDFGCTLDDTELPHHVSNETQIQALMSSFRSVLENLPKPAIVTISRSSHDEYCPRDQVDKIESLVLKAVGETHGSLNITKNFDQ